MTLVLFLILAAIPLAGVVWIALYGSLTTIDGLFTSLILLAMSGILGLTALFELRHRKTGSSAGSTATAGRTASTASGATLRAGKVQDVTFYESNVGQPNKSVVTLSDDGQTPQMLVLDGDLRNALPVGQKVRITLRKEGGQNVLVNVSYS